MIGIAGKSTVSSSFIPVALIDSMTMAFTSCSLLSVLNPFSTALHSVGTYLVLLCVPSTLLYLDSIVFS